MRKIDVLAAIHNKAMTVRQAYDFYDEVMEYDQGNWEKYLLMSDLELRANMHGVGYVELAKWRYQGWPKNCQECGESIDIENENWMAISVGVGGGFVLVHISCLPLGDDEEVSDGQ